MRVLSILAAGLALLSPLGAEVFPGWQGLRVIKAENGAHKMMPIRDTAEAARSLLLVETRQSRLEIYRYVGPDQAPAPTDPENPNFLPMAEDFERTEIPLPRLPHVATVFDFDGDGIDEILYAQGDPSRLIALRKEDDGWKQIREWEISDADLSSSRPILVRRSGDGLQILVSFSTGIQLIDYEDKAARAEWLQPRERDIERNRWWLVDLDGDGDEDIVEARNSVNSPIRWYEAEGSSFRPAVNISDDVSNTNVARLIRTSDGPKVVFLGANQANTISFYELSRSEESPLGRRNLLPLMQPAAGGWTSSTLEGSKAILELDRTKPLMKLYLERDGYWEYKESYPVLQKIESLEAVRDEANTVLFRVENEGQLFKSHWDGERFTFPKRLSDFDDASGNWRILAFDQYDDETWWVTQRGDQLVLSLWSRSADDVREVVFPGVSGEYESAVWIGGESLLVRKKFSKSAEICRLVDGVAKLSSTRFRGDDLRRLQYRKGNLYLAENGVVQKLDENLEALDQIMFEGDRSIRSFAPINDTAAYALEDTGEHVHRMEADDAGIFRSAERMKVPYSLEVTLDPVLGLTLVSSNAIDVPSEGSSKQLTLDHLLDPNEGVVREYGRKTLGTLFVVDVEGDGVDEVATVDYGQRDIIIYGKGEEGYEETISWKVFDDEKYPYGQDPNARNTMNPYRMLSFDIDGDACQDLVLASHDRILIYLAKESDQ